MGWYYLINDQENGPVDENALISLAQQGQIKPDDWVWNPSIGDQWVQASTLPQLFPRVALPPHPPKPVKPQPAQKVVARPRSEGRVVPVRPASAPPSPSSQPLRLVGLKVVMVFTAFVLLGVLLTILTLIYGITGSSWVVRGFVLITVTAYIGYICWLSNPRLPLVTAEDRDPLSVRVYDSVLRMSQKAGIPMPRVVIDPGEEVNAFTFGLSPRKAFITMYEGLLAKLPDNRELDAVVAHEVSHIVNRDCAAGTALNFVVLLARGMHSLSSFLFAVGAQSAGCFSELIGIFAQGGLVGLIIALGLLCFFLYLMSAIAFLAGLSFVLTFVSVLAVSAFSRQRENVADDYAAKVVGAEPTASALAALAEASPDDRLMVCQLLGFQPGSPTPVPRGDVLKAVREQKISFAWGARLAELFSDHPLLLRRIQRLLGGPGGRGNLQSLLAAVVRQIEAHAQWLTPAHRAAGRNSWEREKRVFIFAIELGLLSAVAASFLPSMSTWLACLVFGVGAGLALGAGISYILAKYGPFLGADVVDATLTGALGWFLSGTLISAALFLHNGPALFVAAPVVLLVGSAVSVAGYIVCPPWGEEAE